MVDDDGHEGIIQDLDDTSPGAAMAVTASVDHRARIIPLDGGEIRALVGHSKPIAR